MCQDLGTASPISQLKVMVIEGSTRQILVAPNCPACTYAKAAFLIITSLQHDSTSRDTLLLFPFCLLNSILL